MCFHPVYDVIKEKKIERSKLERSDIDQKRKRLKWLRSFEGSGKSSGCMAIQK